MVNLSHSFLASSAALGLAACGGGSEVSRAPTIPANEELLRIYSDGTGDLGDALGDGVSLTARSVARAGLSLNYATGDTGIADPTVSIRKNTDGELTVVIDEVEHVFKPGDREVDADGAVYGYSVEDPDAGAYYSAFSYSGQLDDFLASGNGYAKILGYQTNQTEGSADVRGFAVVGTESMDGALTSLPTATYNGFSRIDLVPEAGFVGNGSTRTVLNSDVTMTADFGEGNISGEMTNFTLRDVSIGTDDPVAGSVGMNRAPFTVNAFAGNLSPDFAFASSTGISNFELGYSGAFYGPLAEEAAGGISGTAQRNGVDQNGSGFFILSKD